jgi:hypothetical protein
MARIDIDALLAAKAEETGEDHVFTFRGENFTVPADALALELAEAYLHDDASTIARVFLVLLGPEQYARFKALEPKASEMSTLLEGVQQLYGMGADSPGSRASGVSSPNDSESSRPTSDASTPSTSPEPSSDVAAPA